MLGGKWFEKSTVGYKVKCEFMVTTAYETGQFFYHNFSTVLPTVIYVSAK